MFQALQVSCTRNERILFSDLNIALKQGDVLQIIGPNGSGKTSLLRVCCGLLQPHHGEVLWRGQNILDNKEFLTDLVYIGHKQAINAQLTVRENIRIMLALRENYSSTTLNTLLERSGLAEYEHQFVFQLSAGQKQRLNLARLCDPTSKLWLLDEPLTALDQSAIEHFAQQIETHSQQGGIVIFSSHQTFSLKVITKTIHLDIMRG